MNIKNLSIFTKVNSRDSEYESMFRCMYPIIDKIHTNFYKYHNTVVVLISEDDAVSDCEDHSRKLFDLMFYQCKAYFFKLPLASASPQQIKNP